MAEDVKPWARAMISAFLAAQPEPDRSRLWVRVNPLDGPHALADLAAVLPARRTSSSWTWRMPWPKT